MTEQIETIQKRACRIIFGWETDYKTLIDMERVESLASRREKLVLNFAKKASKSERFGHWFKKKEYGEINVRNKKQFEEEYARTDRLRKSPIFYMRRELNKNL